uniref:Uncharacterized protein n=1 Tax=Eptatretus burgeri TaxID=7764 RepID=A0A8C4QSN9_EPTBU
MKGRRSERKWTVASAEFACGLLALCHPLEVRFLAACLEEMARRDGVALRNAEDRANSANSDASARGRLLVSLALLRSDNREAAALLCRALQGNGPQRDELLLLYTMASNHPAIAFQHKQTFRQVLHGLRKSLRIARRAHTEVRVRRPDL